MEIQFLDGDGNVKETINMAQDAEAQTAEEAEYYDNLTENCLSAEDAIRTEMADHRHTCCNSCGAVRCCFAGNPTDFDGRECPDCGKGNHHVLDHNSVEEALWKRDVIIEAEQALGLASARRWFY